MGEVEEYFANMLREGDTFMFAGRLLRFIRIPRKPRWNAPMAAPGIPAVPAYAGARLPLSTNLAARRARHAARSVGLARLSRTGA